MVEADIGDNRQHRRDNIGTVESAPQTDLYDGDIYVLFGKIVECQRRSYLEKRRLYLLYKSLIFSNKGRNPLFGNHFPVDTYAFAEVFQMWRRI